MLPPHLSLHPKSSLSLSLSLCECCLPICVGCVWIEGQRRDGPADFFEATKGRKRERHEEFEWKRGEPEKGLVAAEPNESTGTGGGASASTTCVCAYVCSDTSPKLRQRVDWSVCTDKNESGQETGCFQQSLAESRPERCP